MKAPSRGRLFLTVGALVVTLIQDGGNVDVVEGVLVLGAQRGQSAAMGVLCLPSDFLIFFGGWRGIKSHI